MIAAVVVAVVSLAQEVPGQIDQLRLLLTGVDADVTTLMASMVVTVVIVSGGSALVVGLLAVLVQTVGMVRVKLIQPRIRWFQQSSSAVAALVAGAAGVLSGSLLWYYFGRQVVVALREPIPQGVALLISTVTHASWVFVGLLLLIAVAAVSYTRWRFR
jgi:hypothetical protein